MHVKPPTQLNQGRRHTHNKEGINMDTTMQAGHDSGTTPIQALAGVRVVASMLGNSRKPKKKTRAVFLCPNTGGSHGLPTLHDPGRRSHTQQHARARYGGNSRKKDPRP